MVALLLENCACVYHLQVVGRLGPGDYFGEKALLADETRN